jgi:predicted dienelactone hydrolase
MKKSFTLCVLLIVIAVLGLLPGTAAAQQPGKGTPPLAGPGPYVVGERTMTFVDASRDGRKIDIAVWYPAIAPANPDKRKADSLEFAHRGWPDAVPDTKGAPYPLILYSGFHEAAENVFESSQLTKPLASRGFVVVSLSHLQSDRQSTLVDRPLDILFVIDQLATITTGDLAGLIDADHAGVMGWDYGGYAALALTGARIDPTSANAWASKPFIAAEQGKTDTHPRNLFPDWNWDNLAAYRASLSPLKAGELWPPFTDKRIKAALMFGPCFVPMFGDKGLAAATMPSFIVGGAANGSCLYEQDTTYAYTHLGSQDRYLLSVANQGYAFVEDRRYEPVLTHFEVAFFGYYLQGHQDYAQYLTAKYVDSLEADVKLGLVWGPYTK